MIKNRGADLLWACGVRAGRGGWRRGDHAVGVGPHAFSTFPTQAACRKPARLRRLQLSGHFGRIADVSLPKDPTIRQRLPELRPPSVRDLSATEPKLFQRCQPLQVRQPSVRDLSAAEKNKILQRRQPV